MTKLDKPLTRVVEVHGEPIVLTLVPEEAGIGAHIKLRLPNNQRAYRAIYISPPTSAESA